MKKIAILDSGIGNLKSICNALQRTGAEARIVGNEKGIGSARREMEMTENGTETAKIEIESADAIILPGVGAFDAAMGKVRGLEGALLNEIGNGKPVLGICLGMQMLFEKSEEGKEKGLGVFKGEAVRFGKTNGLKVPQMGWNQLERIDGRCGLLEGIKENDFVYFVHSYYCVPKDGKIVASETEYGKSFASAVWKKNIFGVQFHPEKSGEAGKRIVENFVEMI